MSPALVDTGVYPFFGSDEELRQHLPGGFKSRGFPSAEQAWYQAPGGDYHEGAYGSGHPGSDPALVAAHVLDEAAADYAILNPPTRGNLPDYRLNSAICAATNRWLADRWLEHDERFRGTIRVNPEDVVAAVREIEQWAGHPRMVQVGVPLQSREPYGKPQFLPIWEAAAAHGLPVAVHLTGGAGIDHPPTPSGHARTYPHFVAFAPLNYFYHLASMLIEGTFGAVPALRVVFADGGLDVLTPLVWRLDTFWRACRDQSPWVTRYPSLELAEHVRFCSDGLEGPPSDRAGAWMDQMGKVDLLMYGSNYPAWSWTRPAIVVDGLDRAQRERVLWSNAADLYELR